MSAAVELDPSKLLDLYITAVRDIQLTRFSAFVSAMIVLYDYLITIDLEVELIWKRRWSIIKVVFLWHRYFGLSCVLFQAAALTGSFVTDRFCSFWFRWETWGYTVLLFSSELVLVLWIWVVYNKNKQMLILLLTLFSAEVAGALTILIRSLSNFNAAAHVIPNITYCLITNASPTLRLLWIPILGYDTILLILFLYKGYQSHSTRSARDQFGMLQMVYKYSFLNFVGIFVSYLTCAVMWTAAEPGLAQIPVGFALSLSITNCTRLLLNIRRAYYIGPEEARRSFHSGIVLRNNDISQTTTPVARWGDTEVVVHEVLDDELAEDVDDVEDDNLVVPMPSIPGHTSSRETWQYELRQMRVNI